jgi:hypothetical protein
MRANTSIRASASVCPKCQREYSNRIKKTRHHLLPLRFFPDLPLHVILCADCHSKLERLIPTDHVMPIDFYTEVVVRFLT